MLMMWGVCSFCPESGIKVKWIPMTDKDEKEFDLDEGTPM